MPGRRYDYHDENGSQPPNYERAIRDMTDAELEEEIEGGRGDDGYRAALIAEHDARARAGAPVPR